jgi:cell division protein FtsQ
MTATQPIPLDVRLMNLSAALLLAVFAVLCAAAAGRWVARWSVFEIEKITVTGDTHYNNSVTLRANVAPRISGTFSTVDLEQVRRAFESAPWVRRAVVHREFPNRLRVVLQEHQSAALWGSEGELRLINTFGEVFEANVDEVDQDSLPTLSGPEGQAAEVLAMYVALAPQFAAMQIPLEALKLSGGGSWTARLASEAVIELGRGSADDVLARVQRFLKTLTQVVTRYGRGANALESADLRHENGYAIRLRGVTTQRADEVKQ